MCNTWQVLVCKGLELDMLYSLFSPAAILGGPTWLYCGVVGRVDSMPGWPGPIIGTLWFTPGTSIPPPPPPPIVKGSWLLLLGSRGERQGERREREEGE